MNPTELAGWLQARLASEAGAADFRALLAAGVEAALDAPLEVVVPETAFARALDQVLSEPTAVAAARAADPLFFAPIAERTREVEEGLGHWLDESAKERLERLAQRPGLVDPEWIDVLFSQAATEQLFADTLFRALDDFSEAVPKVVQEMTPAALGRIASRLGGATSGVRDRLRDEVRRRLEPEIRRFVEAATRRLLDGAAQFLKRTIDGETALEARRNLLRFGLERPVSGYARQVDDELRAELTHVAEAVVSPEANRRALREALLDVHRQWLAEEGRASLREVLARHDITLEVDAAALTDACWPFVQRLLAHPDTHRVLEQLSAEILDQVGAER
mgnify:CR=1 FL=1